MPSMGMGWGAPSVLWSYCTTKRTNSRETTFFLAFGVEVVILLKVEISSFRTATYSEDENQTVLREKLDLVEERRNCKVLQSKGSEARIWSWVPHPVKGVPRHKRGRAKISRPQLGGTLSGDQNPPQGSLRIEGYGGKTHSPSLERWTSHENITSRGKNVL